MSFVGLNNGLNGAAAYPAAFGAYDAGFGVAGAPALSGSGLGGVALSGVNLGAQPAGLGYYGGAYNAGGVYNAGLSGYGAQPVAFGAQQPVLGGLYGAAQQSAFQLDELTLQEINQRLAYYQRRRQPVLRRQVIKVPGPAGRVQQVVRRLATPQPDVVERVYVVKPQRDVVNLLIERPGTPPPQVQERRVVGRQHRPVINQQVVRVQPRVALQQQQVAVQPQVAYAQQPAVSYAQPQAYSFAQPAAVYEGGYSTSFDDGLAGYGAGYGYPSAAYGAVSAAPAAGYAYYGAGYPAYAAQPALSGSVVGGYGYGQQVAYGAQPAVYGSAVYAAQPQFGAFGAPHAFGY